MCVYIYNLFQNAFSTNGSAKHCDDDADSQPNSPLAYNVSNGEEKALEAYKANFQEELGRAATEINAIGKPSHTHLTSQIPGLTMEHSRYFQGISGALPHNTSTGSNDTAAAVASNIANMANTLASHEHLRVAG